MDIQLNGFLCASDLMRSFGTASQCTDSAVLTQYNQHTAQEPCYRAAAQCSLEIT